jgi:hypothetical protein
MTPVLRASPPVGRGAGDDLGDAVAVDVTGGDQRGRRDHAGDGPLGDELAVDDRQRMIVPGLPSGSPPIGSKCETMISGDVVLGDLAVAVVVVELDDDRRRHALELGQLVAQLEREVPGRRDVLAGGDARDVVGVRHHALAALGRAGRHLPCLSSPFRPCTPAAAARPPRRARSRSTRPPAVGGVDAVGPGHDARAERAGLAGAAAHAVAHQHRVAARAVQALEARLARGSHAPAVVEPELGSVSVACRSCRRRGVRERAGVVPGRRHAVGRRRRRRARHTGGQRRHRGGAAVLTAVVTAGDAEQREGQPNEGAAKMCHRRASYTDPHAPRERGDRPDLRRLVSPVRRECPGRPAPREDRGARHADALERRA